MSLALETLSQIALLMRPSLRCAQSLMQRLSTQSDRVECDAQRLPMPLSRVVSGAAIERRSPDDNNRAERRPYATRKSPCDCSPRERITIGLYCGAPCSVGRLKHGPDRLRADLRRAVHCFGAERIRRCLALRRRTSGRPTATAFGWRASGRASERMARRISNSTCRRSGPAHCDEPLVASTEFE